MHFAPQAWRFGALAPDTPGGDLTVVANRESAGKTSISTLCARDG
jgi:hypothetical protein